MSEIKHEGKWLHRLPENAPEQKLAAAWKREAPNTLGYLLREEAHPAIPVGVTQEEATIAATLIQWLGSPVGRCFLFECGFRYKD